MHQMFVRGGSSASHIIYSESYEGSNNYFLGQKQGQPLWSLSQKLIVNYKRTSQFHLLWVDFVVFKAIKSLWGLRLTDLVPKNFSLLITTCPLT